MITFFINFQRCFFINYFKFTHSNYTDEVSTRTFRGLQDVYDNVDHTNVDDSPNETVDIDRYDPTNDNVMVRDIYVNDIPVVEGILDQMKVMYSLETIDAIPKSSHEGVLYGPNILYGIEKCEQAEPKTPIMMCITDYETPIAWRLNGNSLSLKVCNISIVRPKITGAGSYTCVVNNEIVGCVKVDEDYNLHPSEIPRKKTHIEVSVRMLTDVSHSQMNTSSSSTADTIDLSMDHSSSQEPSQQPSQQPSQPPEAKCSEVTVIDPDKLELGEMIGEGGGNCVQGQIPVEDCSCQAHFA